ncbi:CidA/LrgA family protein [Alicyclobacillus fructus]|uniref:CidA/LrgA family protein n=1 Tax=Alicyclobacillus fructus TaxID=2816082 RepID=UPI001A8E4FBF|nr:CidA/LrgA family protein [Alicyclobacillus fructus]
MRVRSVLEASRLKQAGFTAVQIAVLYGMTALCNAAVRWLHLSVPGSIVGVLLVFLLLKSGVVKLSWLERGADFLIRELLLFFIPSSVGVMAYAHLMKQDGLKVMAVVVVGTALVMTVTGSVAELVWRVRNRQANDARTEPNEVNAS